MGLPLATMFDNAGKFVLSALAVAGGFLLGNLLMLLICRVIAKMAFHTRINRRFEQALRILAGIAVAIIVGWLLFRGGPGWGFGGTGTGEGEGSGGLTPSTTHPSEQTSTTTTQTKPPSEVMSSVLRVRVDRASPNPPTFRFESATESVGLAAAKKVLEDFKAKVKAAPVLEVKVYADSTAVENPDVRALIDHAHELQFATRVEKLAERVP
jgi:hypothetical protein